MSLLEDVFLEDEAGEAQELERVIEGDEFDVRPRTPNSNENSEKEDEAEEDKRRVDHTAKAKHVVKNPRFVLNPARLMGPRGIQIIPEHFKDIKFKGKGHEREDLDVILKKLEHWAYRLYPKFKFDDCLKKIETLGRKRPVMVHLQKIRTDQFTSEETVVQRDSSEDEAAAPAPPEEDEFDRLLQQQIEIARSTPAPGSVRKELHTPVANRSLLAPKATSSPSISDEQKERMIRNRKLAEERRLARLKQLDSTAANDNNTTQPVIQQLETTEIDKPVNVFDSIVIDKDNDAHVVRKLNRSNVMESSDEESDVMTVNESITVDVHNKVQNKEVNSDKDNLEAEETTVQPKDDVDRINDKIINEKKSNEHESVVNDEDDVHVVKKLNMSNVIESSDEECDVMTVNESVTVDVHNKVVNGEINSDKENIEEGGLRMESEDFDNISNDKIDSGNVSDANDKYTVIGELSLNGNKEYEANESELHKDQVVTEHETNIQDGATFLNNKITIDEDSKNTVQHTDDKAKYSENGKISLTEDLMDVDFSDDF